MASNQSVLEQLLQTALSGGGLREGQRAGGRGQTASSPAPATSVISWEACLAVDR